VLRLALEKARAGQARVESPHCPPVLAADTAVVVGDRILGKPSDRPDAAAMLRLLSGRTHQVLSEVALVGEHKREALSISEVRFCAVNAQEVDAYWESGEVCDKSGGYSIQGPRRPVRGGPAGQLLGGDGAAAVRDRALLAAAGIDCLASPRQATKFEVTGA